METRYRDTVSAYILSSDGKVLFGRKDPAKGGVYADCWHTPGGGIEDGETREQAVVREVREETGLDITDAKFDLMVDRDHGESVKKEPGKLDVLMKMTFTVYRVRLPADSSSVALLPGDDLVDLTWLAVDELPSLQLTPPAVAYIAEHGLAWLKP
jgi:8-oxo-dGTP pyrophosphatase MutT (NUDIX family)